MEIYLLRHGIAHDLAPSGRDEDRALTPEGIEKLRRSARGLRSLDFKVELILSSPYVRARETAAVIMEELKIETPPAFTELLIPGAPPAEILGELTRRNPASALLIGHEPHLGRVISLLLSGDPNLPITMKKGGFCKMRCAVRPLPGSATLDWLLAPKHLQKIS